MPVRCALFDMDGTLLDSMPMWHDETIRLLKHHHVANVEKVFQETEPLPLREMCACYHDRYIPELSTDEIYNELMAMVRHAYKYDVRPLKGCRDFLEELAANGVPMAVATSTSEPEARFALAAQGLDGFFVDVISTGGPIRSKEYPDVWLEALKRLGASAQSSWVFEDAPFGLASARKAGLSTVCMLSPHGDRDEDEMRSLSDILVHGYPELSYALLDDFARPADEAAGILDVLVVDGSPQASSPTLIRELAAQSDYVIAADRGCEVLRKAGVKPDVFCGDVDSASADAARWAKTVAVRVVGMPREKYITDLGLALWCARNEAARQHRRANVTVTCASGGRPDLALSVLGELSRNADICQRFVEDGFEGRILSPRGLQTWRLPSDAMGKTFSAISLAPDTILSESGMHWNLDHYRLDLLQDEVSNIVENAAASVSCSEGAVIAFLFS